MVGINSKLVQQRLADADWYQGAIDGWFGRRSYAALLSAVAGADLGEPGLTLGEGCAAHLPGAAIDQPLRLAHFLSQTATETGGFVSLEENLTYSAARLRKVWPKRFPDDKATKGYAKNPEALANFVYGGRLGNGPAASGDGYRYRGRGLIHLTGRSNYAERQGETGIPLVAAPELAAEPAKAVLLACRYWMAKSINAIADRNDIIAVRKAVNGGLNGIEDARFYFARAKTMLT